MVYHDVISSATHLFMATWAVLATLILLKITKHHGIGRWAVGIYGVTMIALYLASGLFHGLIFLKIGAEGLHRPEAVEQFWVFQKLDKSCIFLLIAGSYIPIVVYTLVGWWRVVILTMMNLIGLAGVLSLWLLPTMNHVWLVGFYVGMGLIGLVGFRQICQGVRWRGLHWVAIFTAFYLLGALAEVSRWPTIVPGWVGPHEVLHVFDMAGTLGHFIFLIGYVIVRPPRNQRLWPNAPLSAEIPTPRLPSALHR